ncbi:hypothetical protein [Paenibacillus darwinianus]|uniref:hypothetical protein n=1 Tax=Paenibacillus darwinianus TaxID=1380763 RepID=UPI000AE789E8|nr:hypothetical protein [Paenibacillus darwinianus]
MAADNERLMDALGDAGGNLIDAAGAYAARQRERERKWVTNNHFISLSAGGKEKR